MKFIRYQHLFSGHLHLNAIAVTSMMSFQFQEYQFPKTLPNVQKQSFSFVMHEAVSRNFPNFTAKRLYWTLLPDKVAGSRPASSKIATPVKIFSSEVRDIFRNSCFINHLSKIIPEPVQVILTQKPSSFNFRLVNKISLVNLTDVITG